MQVNNSPKNSNNKNSPIKAPIVDALEDDLVKKIENERKEKEMSQTEKQQQLSKQGDDVKEQRQPDNYMIFERHYEEDEQEEEKQ